MVAARRVAGTMTTVVAVAGLALFPACKKADAAQKMDFNAAPKKNVVPVEVGVLAEGGFTVEVELFGRVEPNQRVRLAAEVPGRLDTFPFDNGDLIKKGQTVARVNARLTQVQLEQARASHALAASALDRIRQLRAKGVVSQTELDAATNAELQSRAARDLAEVNLARATIRSPIAGVANHVNAKQGEFANPGVPLLEVVDVSRVKLTVQVPELDISLVSPGTEVGVRVEAFPARKMRGRVSMVGLTADTTTRTFPVEVTVPNDDRSLRPGMLVRVFLQKQRLENVVVVPRDAVLEEPTGRSVFVVEGDVARRRAVELGQTRGRLSVVRTGLSKGERLITQGQHQVVDGQGVKVMSEAPCCQDAREDGTPAATAQERLQNVQAAPAQ